MCDNNQIGLSGAEGGLGERGVGETGEYPSGAAAAW